MSVIQVNYYYSKNIKISSIIEIGGQSWSRSYFPNYIVDQYSAPSPNLNEGIKQRYGLEMSLKLKVAFILVNSFFLNKGKKERKKRLLVLLVKNP